jgi:hypothetical protein
MNHPSPQPLHSQQFWWGTRVLMRDFSYRLRVYMTALLKRSTIAQWDPLSRQHTQQIWGRGRSYALSIVSQLHFHRAPKGCRWLQALINHWPATLTPAVHSHVGGHPKSVERPTVTAFKRSPCPASRFPFQVFSTSAFEPKPKSVSNPLASKSRWVSNNYIALDFPISSWAEYISARHPISRECYSDQV